MPDFKPKQSVRRFDVFAEFQRIKALDKDKMPDDVAKGYGIWLAKLVAARRFGKATKPDGTKERKGGKDTEPETLVDNKWRTLDDKPQTDALFDKEIVQRMGEDFYKQVFSPAIKKAFQSGKDYTDIRDEIRKDWKPK